MLQGWRAIEFSAVAKRRWWLDDKPGCLVHAAHVPHSRALAREGELQRVLASEGDDHQLQHVQQLQRLEFGDTASQLSEHTTNLQLQLPASRPVWRDQ